MLQLPRSPTTAEYTLILTKILHANGILQQYLCLCNERSVDAGERLNDSHLDCHFSLLTTATSEKGRLTTPSVAVLADRLLRWKR